MWAQNDNSESLGGSYAPSGWAVFLPTLAIAGGYTATLALLALDGAGKGSLARLCMIVLALGVPFLVAHATLRLATTRLSVLPHMVHLHPGFPADTAMLIPYSLIASIEVKRGIGGRLAGSGTLLIRLVNGESVAACDLARPDAAANAIDARRCLDAARLRPTTTTEGASEERRAIG